MLSSRSNPKIKFLESLRKSRDRRKTGLYIVEGERELERAGELKSIFYHQATSFVEKLSHQGVECIQISKSLLEKISMRGEIVGIGIQEKKKLSSLKGSFFIALVGVEKPGNIGAILRSCDGAGVDGVLLVDPLVDHYHPNAIRASLAASLSLNIVTCSTKEAFSFIDERKITLVTTSPDAKKDYTKTEMKFPLLIAMGQEDRGLPEKWIKGEKVSIPMKGICDSLNVSVSAGIILYEVLRQNEH
ncbi:MAG: 23S rRNA (guanosine-2'-O-)-methyltransferase RlmB [Chlamydiia bacterium]|nr:23S rRNA (guanosine-2'-O-)-methyltransferase RlmB [Chlamydiia bacterium]